MSQHKIFICQGTGCQASNSQEIYERLKAEVAKLELTGITWILPAVTFL